MRPLRTFTIEPSLPEELLPLLEITSNVSWSWHADTLALLRRLDPKDWEISGHNPVAMLGRMKQERLEELASDASFLAHMKRVHQMLQTYMSEPGWWPKTYGGERSGEVAYFSAEFGITECLPIYSGGLGVLAGDHLKSASDLDIPLVAVGLLYQQGYFRQRLNADGWQLELFPRNDFYNMPVEQVRNEDRTPLTIDIEVADNTVKAYVWKAQIGRISLYMLDTNVRDNSPEDRHITGQLYGGDQEMRIRQEVVLGIGGVRMLRALGIHPKAFHMNEGHSAFLGLERIRMIMEDHSVSFDVAMEAVAASSVFTTHTPVPAGNDAFDPELIDKYFSNYWPRLGLSREQFMALGRQEQNDPSEPMSLTVLALRMSNFRNGVSALHGDVSRGLWTSVWPGVPSAELPLTSITNGTHTRTWLSVGMSALYDRYLGPGWDEKPSDASTWQQTNDIPDPELWRTHERRRERLVSFARTRLHKQLQNRGAGQSELAAAQEVLDPEALTIGFARRFATYKRATLILSDIERLEALLTNPHRRVQIIFAGKAHPRDIPGKELIRDIVHISRKEPFRRSMTFLEDYDMNVARYLIQGVDVWLNTPLRPMEASGTSGMKAAANGALNVSILDGWWAEGYTPNVGWAIGSGESYDDLEYQNTVESQALYDLLEKEIVPAFYKRGSDNLPREWIAMMKASIRELAPVYSTNRMVREYAERFYVKAADNFRRLNESELQPAKDLAAWRQHIQGHFGNVYIQSVSDNMDAVGHGAQVGKQLRVESVVSLGELHPNDVKIELYYGPLDSDGQLNDGDAVEMEQIDQLDGNQIRYAVEMPCSSSGMCGYTVRAMPRHPALTNPMDMAMIRWA